MRLSITGLAEIRARLAQVRPEAIMTGALAEQAERMAQSVRESLSEPQGAGDHDKPWTRTGALRDSISVTSDGLQAAIGSNDPAAAPQEMGTVHVPPRPYLAPVAAALGAEAAQAIATRVANALRGEALTALPLSTNEYGADIGSRDVDRPSGARTYIKTSRPLMPDATGVTPSPVVNPAKDSEPPDAAKV